MRDMLFYLFYFIQDTRVACELVRSLQSSEIQGVWWLSTGKPYKMVTVAFNIFCLSTFSRISDGDS